MRNKIDQEIPQRDSEKQEVFIMQTCQMTALLKSWDGCLFMFSFPG